MEKAACTVQRLWSNGMFLSSPSDVMSITQAIIQEWQTNPGLLECGIPPWFTIQTHEGHVKVVSHLDQCPQTWTDTREACDDFWYTIDLLSGIDADSLATNSNWLGQFGMLVTLPSPHVKIIEFPGVQPYAQRLSQALVNDQDLLILDLRKIISQYIFFI